jgi:hypothetical protein
MRLHGAKVRALREARPYDSQSEIAMRLRNLGWKGTLPSWVSQVERDMIDVDEPVATGLAAILGVGLSEIMRPEDATRLLLLRLTDQLGEFRHELDTALASMGDPLRLAR